ncbi:DNA repair protein complementing XP-G cells homolog isoform X2 [Cephus cinctus]|nr:DNA repair protein complementing XP-G cells homolog isoform X2 [Cephus cinctus]
MKNDLINNLIKHSIVKGALNKNSDAGPSQLPENLDTTVDDIFKLPIVPNTSQSPSDYDSGSDSSEEISPRRLTKWTGNIHNVDVDSEEFKALPADVRYDILTDLKETRKQNSWGRLHEMPEDTNEFSDFQMKRLLKRRYVQESLENAEKEMGGKTLTLEELNKLLNEQGINTFERDTVFRIASDNITRLIYISDKKAITAGNYESNESSSNNTNSQLAVISEKDETQKSEDTLPVMENIQEYQLDSDWDSDVELIDSPQPPKKYFGKTTLNPAVSYMLEHSGLTQEQILSLIEQNKKDKKSSEKSLRRSEKSVKSECPSSHEKDDMESLGSSEELKEINEISKGTDLISKTVSTESNSESDNMVEVIEDYSNLESIKRIDQSKESITSTTEVGLDSTDSDTDGFIEVEDVHIPNVTIIPKSLPGPTLEIRIKTDELKEDDMFTNVFKIDNTKSLNPETFIPQPQEIPKQDLESSLTKLPDITSEKAIEKEIDKLPEKLKNPSEEQQLLENKTNEEIAHTEKSTDSDIIPVESAETEKSEVPKIQPVILPLDKDELFSMEKKLESEQQELCGEIGKLERQATDITDQMRIEAQELLRLFGIPYIVAPMEAEAQCAYLETINLTDGTITDDSDIWLFGGKCVYKNFFNNNKRVLQFLSDDIKYHFKLTRYEMIQLALLVGSDYTTGVPGIGPVAALEVLAAFPSDRENILRGLRSFYSWLNTGRVVGPGKAGLRNKIKNVQIEKGFPSEAVAQAYLFPTVDESKETFSWGKPNSVLLADYTRQKFGWSRAKFDDIFGPVLKRMHEKKSQKYIDSYFKVKTVPKSIETNLSKRVQKAVNQLGGEAERSDLNEEKKPSKKKKASGKSKKSTVEITPETNPNADTKKVVDNLGESSKNSQEYIPQREKDKANSLKKKLKAIEVFRKSKKGPGRTKKVKRSSCTIKMEAELSESSSSS